MTFVQRKRTYMTEEINQPTPQLTREQSLTPLLREATDLLAIFLSSEETRDLEPLISAQELLASAADLLSPAAQATGIAHLWETSSSSFLRSALDYCACWCRESREGVFVLVLNLP